MSNLAVSKGVPSLGIKIGQPVEIVSETVLPSVLTPGKDTITIVLKTKTSEELRFEANADVYRVRRNLPPSSMEVKLTHIETGKVIKLYRCE